jgi:hypothetical protein
VFIIIIFFNMVLYSTGESILGAFSSFIGTFMRFRVSVLTEFKDVFERDHTTFRSAMATLNNTQKRYILDRGCTLSSSISTLFRDSMNETGSANLVDYDKITTDVNLDSIMLELLGIPIPNNVIKELSDCQLGAEFSLVRRVILGKKGSSAALDINAAAGKTSGCDNHGIDDNGDSSFRTALLGIRDAVVPEIERRTLKHLTSEKNGDDNGIKEVQVVKEMNNMIYQQRLKCVSDRLDILNSKAEGRSRALKLLLVILYIRYFSILEFYCLPDVITQNLKARAGFVERQDLEKTTTTSNEAFLPPIDPMAILTSAKELRKELIVEIQRPESHVDLQVKLLVIQFKYYYNSCTYFNKFLFCRLVIE